jgi:hypothetical protein
MKEETHKTDGKKRQDFLKKKKRKRSKNNNKNRRMKYVA